MLPLFDDLDPGNIHVQEPYSVVFLCGGQLSDNGSPPVSLRDAFYWALDNPIMKIGEWLTAEEVTRRSDFFDNYGDILLFETDLAQIVKLIVLFCESEGSAAELGAFAAIDDILERLYVVVREHHWNDNSFIKLGPLRRVERKIGRKAIQVVADDDVGITKRNISTVDKRMLVEQLHDSLKLRLSGSQEPSTFDPNRSGHIIKIIVGLVQEYGALTFIEITELLSKLNIIRSNEAIKGYLLCARSVGWLTLVPRGSEDYLVSTEKGQDAATFHLKETAEERNKTRRRAIIRDHWRTKDKIRFAAIRAARGTP